MAAESKKVLYVEDEPFFAQTLRRMLEAAGFSVTTAANGEEGMARIEHETFDLILLDLLLPKIDGFEVLRRVRADAKVKHIPVMILSNLGSDEDRQKTEALGATRFYVKALTNPQKIVLHVKELLERV